MDKENQNLDNKTLCEQYANEDGVSKEEMPKYMAEMSSNDWVR